MYIASLKNVIKLGGFKWKSEINVQVNVQINVHYWGSMGTYVSVKKTG